MQGNNKGFWLDDDPEWKALRDRVNNTRVKRPSKSAKANQQTIIEKDTRETTKKLNLSLSLNIPRLRLPRLSRKQVYATGSLIGLGLSVGVALKIVPLFHNGQSDSNNGVLSDSAQRPDYEYLLPDGSKDKTTTGKVAYDSERKVTSFTDTIGNINITVSQQPLPEEFKSNPDASIDKLAKDFSANEVINESNPKAYLGTSVKGPQTLIFHKKGILVFIQSSGKLDRENWAAYITTLL